MNYHDSRDYMRTLQILSCNLYTIKVGTTALVNSPNCFFDI